MKGWRAITHICALGGFSCAAMFNSFHSREEKDDLEEYNAARRTEREVVASALLNCEVGLASTYRFPGFGNEGQEGSREGLMLHESWSLRGAWDDDWLCSFPSGWLFPYEDGHLTRVWVSSQGRLHACADDESPLVEFGPSVALIPGISSFEYGLTASNTFALIWHNAVEERDLSRPFEGRIELFRNGDVGLSSNGETRIILRDLPFAHDGYGQDEEWVRAHFDLLKKVDGGLTNVDQVLSVGYANWVDSKVGFGLTNGLFKFTADFSENPLETTRLRVGDYALAVTNAGECVFVLKKGEEYEFDTWPGDERVDYWMQDDLGPDAPTVASWSDERANPGEWSVDGGWRWISVPHQGLLWRYPGYCGWMPILQGAPNVTHLSPDGSPFEFSANLIDYLHPDRAAYSWTSPDEMLDIFSPQERSTLVSPRVFQGFDRFQLAVAADLGGLTLRSFLDATYGVDGYPGVAVRVSAPKVVFLNDDDRSSRYYYVDCSVYSPVDTNVTLSIRHAGDTSAVFSEDEEGMSDLAFPISKQLSLSAGTTEHAYGFFFRCVRSGAGSWNAEVRDEIGLINSDAKTYQCIEPVCKLITTAAEGDTIINPSRLVYGADAWLGVEQNGSYPRQEIRWRVVSGPGEIVDIKGYRACVRATSTTGTVVVEAAFGSDARIQPSFVLPIVEKKRVPVRAYWVPTARFAAPARLRSLENDIDLANRVFAQVGVEFYIDSRPSGIGDLSYSVLPVHDDVVLPDGRIFRRPCLSRKGVSLLRLLPEASECIRVVYVSQLVQGTEIAFTMPNNRAIVVGAEGGPRYLAHELGHALGLKDIYAEDDTDCHNRMAGYGDEAYKEIFGDKDCDWGASQGRGFYEKSDTHGALIEALLMHGFDSFGGVDIPSGTVLGLSNGSQGLVDKTDVVVGADEIRRRVR